MIKKLVKVGDSQALILDQAMLDAIGLREGDEVEVTVQDHAITIAGTQNAMSDPAFEKAAKHVFKEHGEALRRLA